MNNQDQRPKIRRTSRWVLVGGALLAFMASAVNAEFLLSLGASVSHLTGDITKITTDAIIHHLGWTSEMSLLTTAVWGFLGGAMASGYFIHYRRLSIEKPYGRAISIIGLAVLGAGLLQATDPLVATFLGAAACGFQNALATHYKGLVLRTTHVTGVMTDLGEMMGMRLRGHHIESWKMLAQFMIITAYVGGAVAGAVLHIWGTVNPLYVLGGLYLAGGLSWSFVKHKLLRM